ncbi:hypothetical protein I79_010062 [Cricetulus griseus]|uniref:Uncharacterized protein n=1 Tax=Cricetulus griseus TaxID=10029 RepID=G3HHG1_CRIGR|nr:hypothetical protein I79_010062 [Cricetulus griseus]
MEQYIYKRKRDGIYIINLKSGRSCCWQPGPLLPLRTPLMSASSPPGTLGNELC